MLAAFSMMAPETDRSVSVTAFLATRAYLSTHGGALTIRRQITTLSALDLQGFRERSEKVTEVATLHLNKSGWATFEAKPDMAMPSIHFRLSSDSTKNSVVEFQVDPHSRQPTAGEARISQKEPGAVMIKGAKANWVFVFESK